MGTEGEKKEEGRGGEVKEMGEPTQCLTSLSLGILTMGETDEIN